jgi:hypothetical protein
MAEEGAGQQQKILLLPPMKGLNLYDNPFTMDPSFAVELVNFMPPTTVMTVRPGIQKLAKMYGAVRGLYSYATGAAKSYGEGSWYEQTIEDGEHELLLLKFSQNQGNSIIYSFNPLSLECESIASIPDHTYTKDSTNFKHSMFFCSGNQFSPMYVWNARIGFKPMEFKSPGSGHPTLSDLENVTFYNGYLYANSYNTFDVYFMLQKNADPTGKAGGWGSSWDFFSPTYAGHFSIDGVANKGGAIMKIFTMSRSGLNDINAYLVICTNMGEVILYKGSPDMGEVILYKGSPEEKDNEWKWQPTGRFEIPVPLNKDSFAIMEGDIIVATRNGLVSLMRVVFGQSTNVTQSLETRIKNLFSDYMFRMNEFKSWIKLFYNFKNRLLILNVPTQMPIPFNEIEIGYKFTHEQVLMLPSQYNGGIARLKTRMGNFIVKYLYANWIDYNIFIQFNESKDDGIYISFETDVESVEGHPNHTITYVDFYIICNGEVTDFLNKPTTEYEDGIRFKCDDFTALAPIINFDETIPFQWNETLKKTYKEILYYGFPFPKFKNASGSYESFTVTNIITEVDRFADDTHVVRETLISLSAGEEIKGYNVLAAADNVEHYNWIASFPKDKTYNKFEERWIDGCKGRHLENFSEGSRWALKREDINNFFHTYGSIPNDVPLMMKQVLIAIVESYESFFDHVVKENPNTIDAIIDYTIECTHLDKKVEYFHYTLKYTIEYWWYDAGSITDRRYHYNIRVRLKILDGMGIGNKGVEVYMVNADLEVNWGSVPSSAYIMGIDMALEHYIKDNNSLNISNEKEEWTRSDVYFDNNSLNLSDENDKWKVFNVSLNVTGPQEGLGYFCSNPNRVFPWQVKENITKEELKILNDEVGVYPFAIFILEQTPPTPVLPPDPPEPFPELTATINNYWEGYSPQDVKAFRVSEKFVNVNKGEYLEGYGYNDIFRGLEKRYNELGENDDLSPGDITNPLKEKVRELFYNVAINFINNSKRILSKLDFKEKGSSGKWTYGYDVYDVNEGDTKITSMRYEIGYDYHYFGSTKEGEGDRTTVTYSINLRYNDGIYSDILKGSITFITKGDSVYKISYKGSDTEPAFKFKAIPFDDFEDIGLKNKKIVIKNAQWSLVSDPAVADITGILIKTKNGVFPSKKIGTITNGTGAAKITKSYYGWMFSNFGFYGGIQPAPPGPVPEDEDIINEMHNGDIDKYSSFKAEATFYTLLFQDYNKTFSDLASHYNDLGNGVSPATVINPLVEEGVVELFYNVVHNLDENLDNMVRILINGDNTGTWTYGYDINEGNTTLAHMEYEVAYKYNFDSSTNIIICTYTITLKYTGNDNTEPKNYEYNKVFFSGTMTFYEKEGEYLINFPTDGFKSENVPFNSLQDFPGINLEGKTITITNAYWELKTVSGYNITDILVTGNQTMEDPHTVFPSPNGNVPIENDDIVEEIKKFYGWMFSNFVFYGKEETKKEIKEETKKRTKPTSLEVFKKRKKNIPAIVVPRGSLGDYPHVEAVKNTNFDLTLIPLLTGINILAPFRSSQYVMDSSYGTWSQWKDINMVDGIDHVNEFYFIIPQDFKPDVVEEGFIYNQSFLCKFNPEASGDFEDMFSQETKPISVSYKTAATNFGNNNIKQISKIKLYGSASTFWGYKANYLKVTMHSDFFENPYQKYQHTKEGLEIRKALGLGADFDLRSLTYSQIKEYQMLYAEASSHIRNIEMGLICKPANRIALEVDMKIEEHNIIIYGYELYFKILNKL